MPQESVVLRPPIRKLLIVCLANAMFFVNS